MERVFISILLITFFTIGCNSIEKKEITEKTEDMKTQSKENNIDYGRNIVQCGECIYFCDSNDDKKSNYGRAVYSVNQEYNEKKKIVEIYGDLYATGKLFVFDNYIFVNDYIDDEYVILRISIDDNKVKTLSKGILNCIDAENGEVYYSHFLYYDSYEKNTEIFKMDVNGENVKLICLGKYEFLHKDNDVVYLEGMYDKNAVLMSINSDSSDLRKIVEIPCEYREYEKEPERITEFGIAGDWIFLSVGSYQGSGNFFYGNLVRLKKDGTEFERLIDEPIEHFYIIGDYIYFNYEYYEDNKKQGCWRMRTDLSGKEHIGDKIGMLKGYFDDGYLYGEAVAASDSNKTINDLRQLNIEKNEVISLFDGNKALMREDSNYLGYYVTEKVNEFIYFWVEVHGYNRDNDNWRGHTCYEAFYRVRDNGEDLRLLYERT